MTVPNELSDSEIAGLREVLALLKPQLEKSRQIRAQEMKARIANFERQVRSFLLRDAAMWEFDNLRSQAIAEGLDPVQLGRLEAKAAKDLEAEHLVSGVPLRPQFYSLALQLEQHPPHGGTTSG